MKCLEFCGRQGIALRGHRDDETRSSFNKGNFRALLALRVDAGDKVLEHHLDTCAKNATYTSKTTQNDLLLCVKQFIQTKLINEVKNQAIGAYYGFQCDEVTDSSNWEQLGLILRYVNDHQPVERLLEYIPCDSTTGEALCQNVIQALTDAGLDIKLCRSQTMDGAGNMAGKYAGFAARFLKESPRALYHYCSSHDLNLALCKACDVKEIHLMLDALKQLGLFFKYSPKRSRRLEVAVDEVNQRRCKSDQISKTKLSMFCETRWVEKHTTIQDFHIMYEPLLNCLEAISCLESHWDAKAVTDAYGLMKRITDSTFIACFQTVNHFFGYTKGLSCKLQGSTLDVIQGYEKIKLIRSVLANARSDEVEYDVMFEKMSTMVAMTNSDAVLEIPRRCGKQSQRNNEPADTPKQYYKIAVYIPFLDSLLQQFTTRFGDLAQQAIRALSLIPSNIGQQDEISSLDYYRDDMPSPDTLRQEVVMWRAMWKSQQMKATTLAGTISDSRACATMYPNITTIINLLLLTSVTSSGVERANSSLRFVKNAFRSTMGEDRFNALILMYVNNDIEINIEEIIDIFATKHPRRMLLSNPLL